MNTPDDTIPILTSGHKVHQKIKQNQISVENNNEPWSQQQARQRPGSPQLSQGAGTKGDALGVF